MAIFDAVGKRTRRYKRGKPALILNKHTVFFAGTMWKGEMVMVPEIRTVQHPEKFQILYRITYDNGTTADRWVDVSRDEYTAFGG